MESDRRQVIQDSAGKTPPSEPIPKRRLGRTGEQLSILGFGGIVVMNAEPAHAANVVSEAIDRGVNYFDVAPGYGNAQSILGPALKPHRDKAFLACKTGERSREGAEKELEESLRLLQTDHIDLYQLHGITDVEKDVETALGPDGAMETFVKAREAGKVRYLGFSAHSPKAALAAMKQFDFDTILYPTNLVCHFNAQFEREPLEMAREKGMGILALKAMARTLWEHASGKNERDDYGKCWYEPLTNPEEALMGLRFTLSQAGLTAALPPGEESLFRLALDLAPRITPMTEKEMDEAQECVRKIVPIFDAT